MQIYSGLEVNVRSEFINLNLCMLVILHAFLSFADFLKILSGMPSECQTVWIQIRSDRCLVGPHLGPNFLQTLSVESNCTT